MENQFIARSSIVINASPANIWEALTNPELIKQYLFGTEASSDWEAGSPITYKGTWQGKPYEDKGTILKIEPERMLQTTYWSSFSGQPDLPENYQRVTYEIFPEDTGTRLTITQENIATEASRDHSAANWQMVLESLKKLLED